MNRINKYYPLFSLPAIKPNSQQRAHKLSEFQASWTKPAETSQAQDLSHESKPAETSQASESKPSESKPAGVFPIFNV